MTPKVRRWLHRGAALSIAVLAPHERAEAQLANTPQPYAIRNVRLTDQADSSPVTLILRNGRIESIAEASAKLPDDVRSIEGVGRLVLPAFIDAYTHAGCATPEPQVDRDRAPKPVSDVWVDMREASRKGIQPSFRAADVLKLEEELAKSYRSLGFGYFLSAPHGQLLSGRSALSTTRDAAARDTIVEPAQFDHASFSCTGAGYPTTLMGSIAHLRQFFLDAGHVRVLADRYASGNGNRRPPYDAELAGIRPAVDKARRVVCEADEAGDIDRWIRLADEVGIDIAISGGREAWKRAAVLSSRTIPVFLTLDWGDEVDDPHAKEKEKSGEKPGEPPPKPGDTTSRVAKPEAPAAAPDARVAKPDAPETEPDSRVAEPDAPATAAASAQGAGDPAAEPVVEAKKPDAADEWRYVEPLRVREEKRRLWEESRDGAMSLSQAGVAFAFGSGKNTPRETVERVRKLVEAGLPIDVALRHMTTDAARLLGVDSRTGQIAAGFDATLALWTAHPLSSKDAKVAWLFVEGYPHEFDVEVKKLEGKPDEDVDATGTWVFEFDDVGAKPATAELKMDPDGKVRGTIRYRNPSDDANVSGEFEGQVAGRKIELEGRVKFGVFEAQVEVSGEIDGDEIEGESRWRWSGGDDTRKFRGRREPEQRGGAR